MKLSERIARWRESKGLTVLEFAGKIGVTPEAVYQWEGEKFEPTHDRVETIAKVLGVSLSEFWGEPPARKKKPKAAS